MGFELITPQNFLSSADNEEKIAEEIQILNRFQFRLGLEAAGLKLGYKEGLTFEKIMEDCVKQVQKEFPMIRHIEVKDPTRPDHVRLHFFVSNEAENQSLAQLQAEYEKKSPNASFTATIATDKYGPGNRPDNNNPCPCCNQTLEPELLARWKKTNNAYKGLKPWTRAHNVIPHSSFKNEFFAPIFAELLVAEGKSKVFTASDLKLIKKLDEAVGDPTGTGVSLHGARQCPICEVYQKDDALLARYVLMKDMLKQAMQEKQPVAKLNIQEKKGAPFYHREASALVGEQWGATPEKPLPDLNELVRLITNYGGVRIAAEADRILNMKLIEEMNKIAAEIISNKNTKISRKLSSISPAIAEAVRNLAMQQKPITLENLPAISEEDKHAIKYVFLRTKQNENCDMIAQLSPDLKAAVLGIKKSGEVITLAAIKKHIPQLSNNLERDVIAILDNPLPTATINEIKSRLSPILKLYLEHSEKIIWLTRRQTVRACAKDTSHNDVKFDAEDMAKVNHTVINRDAAKGVHARFSDDKEELPTPKKLCADRLNFFIPPAIVSNDPKLGDLDAEVDKENDSGVKKR